MLVWVRVGLGVPASDQTKYKYPQPQVPRESDNTVIYAQRILVHSNSTHVVSTALQEGDFAGSGSVSVGVDVSAPALITPLCVM